MPSSIRSSRSTRSPKPPAWRNVTISKSLSATTTSLSYVFAEPEQGSPLAPAASRLPTSGSSTNGEDTPAALLRSRSSASSLASRQRTVESKEQDSAARVQGEPSSAGQGSPLKTRVDLQSLPQAQDYSVAAQDPTPHTDVSVADTQQATDPSNPPAICITNAEPASSSSAAFLPSNTPPIPAAPKSSWFGSLSRAKGKVKSTDNQPLIAPLPDKAFTAEPDSFAKSSTPPENMAGRPTAPTRTPSMAIPGSRQTDAPSQASVSLLLNKTPSSPPQRSWLYGRTQPSTPRSNSHIPINSSPLSTSLTDRPVVAPLVSAPPPNVAAPLSIINAASSDPTPTLEPNPTTLTLRKDIPPPPPPTKSWFYSSTAPLEKSSSPQVPTTDAPSPPVIETPSTVTSDPLPSVSCDVAVAAPTDIIHSTPEPAPPVQLVPAPKRSWFYTSTPASNTSTSIPNVAPEASALQDETSTASQYPGQTSSSSPPHAQLAPESLEEVKDEPPQPKDITSPPPKRSWLYSSPVPADPTPPKSIPASIDEEVPPLVAGSPPMSPGVVVPSPSPGATSENGGRQKLLSLNPSSSRFMISIPLLGRPKVPLDQVPVEDGKAGEQDKQSNEVSTPAVEEPLPTPTITIVSADSSSTADVAPAPATQGDAPSTSSEQTHEVPSSSSWWGYIGWGGTSESSTSVGPKAEEAESDTHVNPNLATAGEDVPSSAPSSSPATMKTLEEPDTAQAIATVPAEQPALTTSTNHTAESGDDASKTGGEVGKAQSLRSVGSQGLAPSLSAWYSPWTWYASGSIEGAEAAGEDAPAMTQAEMVKEAALARPEAGSEKVEEEKRQEAEVERAPDVNPVEAMVTANRSGWASFFSSRSLMMKTITNGPPPKVDENGIEVMDLDFDEEEPAAVAAEEPQRGRDLDRTKAVGGDTRAVAENMPTATQSKGTKAVATSTKPATTTSRSSSLKRDDASMKGTTKPAPPLVTSDAVKKRDPATKKKDTPTPATKPLPAKSASPAPSTKSAVSVSGSGAPVASPRAQMPNLILPTWADTFHTAPRSVVPPPPVSKFSKTLNFVNKVLFAADDPAPSVGKGKGRERDREREREYMHFGKELPRAYDVVQDKLDPDVLGGCKRVVVIGIHGWFPGMFAYSTVGMCVRSADCGAVGAVMRTVLGEPTGTSGKFVNMMVQALEEFQERHDVKLEKITKVPLEGEGTIEGRVAKLYANLQANQEWMDDVHAADAILVATHSQGSIVSTHLLDRLIRDQHIRTSRNTVLTAAAEASSAAGLTAQLPRPQRVCCLALCGIHLGPLRYLSSSSLLQPYFQYFESAAARELFEFQNTDSEVSKKYVQALRSVLDHGAKMVYVASLNDQVVPIYSGLFTAASHPLILRALYIDGDAHNGLTVHLSEATAGSLNGVGHSTVYEEISTYALAVNYLFLTNDGLDEQHSDLILEPFNATMEQNDYEIPWSLRDVIADERVAHFFSTEIVELRDAFRHWHPKTTILRDLKRKLQPIQRLPATFQSSASSSAPPSTSKL
ncbi:hypothetical protein H0H81_007357 [Sphagnurus paluster]|uniref:YMC020W-like alpha/beta hydrolase domain-containing protein n=1 Tax=Sphagnurus paluster TaxID=117069 RepID=A0A9P7GNK1_9AGAR|nr:hypothetical protein H0H81_007357 [Sphagnurus paluster]